MPADWLCLARADDVSVDRDIATVFLPSGRRHLIRVLADGEAWRLEAAITGARTTASLDDPAMWAWERSRGSRLVSYRIDRRGRLVAEAWTPRAGLTADLFLMLLRTLAHDADRQELLLSGADPR